MKQELILEIEDMIYGFEHYSELRPNEKRILALKELNNETPQDELLELIKIFEEGHGILSNEKRINLLKKSFNKIKWNIQKSF